MKSPLTPEQKLQKKQRDALQVLYNRVSSAFNFGKIKSWRDVWLFEGVDETEIATRDNKDKSLTFAELREYYDKKKQVLEVKFAAPAKPAQQAPAIPAPQPIIEPPSLVSTDESGIKNDLDYGLQMSPSEKAYLFWFQKKATKELFDGVVKRHCRNQLLLASTGTGKTFIVGGFVRRLVDIKFADGKTFGSTKYLYVTRATIVEQTKRVFANEFNLSIKDGVEILNIEQLRSRAGQVWVNEKVIVEGGEEKTIWEWRPMLHPVVFILDECQSAKNDNTSQSDIVRAYAKLPINNTHMVFVSATPFTRVSEAKSFVLNLHMVDNEFNV